MQKINSYFGICEKHDHNYRHSPCPFPNCENGVNVKDGVVFIAVSPNGWERTLKRISWNSPSRGIVYGWYELDEEDPHSSYTYGIYRKEAYNARQPEIDNPKIYHYTDINGLKGIFGKDGLWMTDHRFLNDTEEIKYGINVFLEVLSDFESQFSQTEELKKIYSLFSAETIIIPTHYIACFSNNRDNLPLWRTYTSEDGGYAIGFSRKKFSGLDLNTIERGTCLYDLKKQKAIFCALFNTFFELHSLYKQNLIISHHPYDIAGRFLRDIWYSVLIMKDQSFSSEEEFRMVTNESFDQDPEFRIKNKYLVPYVKSSSEFSIESFPEPGTILSKDELSFSTPTYFIEEIVIGPSPYSDRMELGLRQFLESKNFGTTRIEHSKIPFRAL